MASGNLEANGMKTGAETRFLGDVVVIVPGIFQHSSSPLDWYENPLKKRTSNSSQGI